MRIFAVVSLAVAIAAGPCAGAAEAPRAISCQGMIFQDNRNASELSWNVSVVDASGEPFLARVDVFQPDGSRRHVYARGDAFFVSDLGLVIAVQSPEARALPGRIAVRDINGADLWESEIEGLSCPVLSADGTWLAYLDGSGTSVLDLTTLTARSYERLFPFAVSPDGRLAGVRAGDPQDGAVQVKVPAPTASAGGDDRRELVVTSGPAVDLVSAIEGRPSRLAFAPDGSILLLYARYVSRVGAGGRPSEFYRAPDGVRLRDLVVRDGQILVGGRRHAGDEYEGTVVALDEGGRELWRERSEALVRPNAQVDYRPAGYRGLPWPLAPNTQHEVGNTYGEYQNYGGSPYLHPGVDVMGSGGDPVYAVAPGVVKAVLTTSGQWHWRVAVADSATSGTSTGYLYAHLSQPSIVHDVGDTVAVGEYLGDLVTWPVSDFHHCHFARIEDEGEQWYGNWMATDNPHTDFEIMTETSAPLFEPARGSDLLAFCSNETSTYLDPDALSGQVDIIAHVSDTIQSSWACSVQEIRYTIYPAGYAEFPVVDNKLSVNFDMALDTYIGGPIDPFLVELLYKQDATCRTQGNYDSREFYHVITNSDGNEDYETSDLSEAWDTTPLPDADYVVRVTAVDANGNAAVDSMTVTTVNGNASGVSDVASAPMSFAPPLPNPALDGTLLSYSLGYPASVEMSVYSVAGRRVRRLVDEPVPAGSRSVYWNLKDESGGRVASGVYMVELRANGDALTRKLVVSR